MPENDTNIRERIRDKALDMGFDSVAFTRADLPPEVENRLAEFLKAGRHGDMAWMENRMAQRAHPQALWPEAQSVIMLGANYGPESDPLGALERKDEGVISVYAQNRDYHDIIKKRLKALGRWIASEFGCELKVFVDTAPVMEKPLAAQAGLGWQGKHTNLVSRDFGSWLFLGSIFTTLEIDPDAPQGDACGSCRNCLDACPTDAFPAPYQLDARRCISYLTIEHQGPIPREFRAAMGNRIYGCDDCLAVCPWNKFASQARDNAFHARETLDNPPLADLAALDDGAFRALFTRSPVKRTGRDRFVRNVAIAMGNSANRDYVDILKNLAGDPAPVVRGAAAWALSRLMTDAERGAFSQTASEGETDETVLEEWRAPAQTEPATRKAPTTKP